MGDSCYSWASGPGQGPEVKPAGEHGSKQPVSRSQSLQESCPRYRDGKPGWWEAWAGCLGRHPEQQPGCRPGALQAQAPGAGAQGALLRCPQWVQRRLCFFTVGKISFRQTQLAALVKLYSAYFQLLYLMLLYLNTGVEVYTFLFRFKWHSLLI